MRLKCINPGLSVVRKGCLMCCFDSRYQRSRLRHCFHRQSFSAVSSTLRQCKYVKVRQNHQGYSGNGVFGNSKIDLQIGLKIPKNSEGQTPVPQTLRGCLSTMCGW